MIFEIGAIKATLTVFTPYIYDLLKIPVTPSDVTNFFLKTFNDMVNYRKLNSINRKDFLDSLIELMNKGKLDDYNDSKKGIK